MSDIQYQIRAFDEANAQLIVEFDGMPLVAVDLIIDENGNVPEGEALDSAIRQYMPTWHMERKRKLESGIANAEAIKALVVPSPQLEALKPSKDSLERETRNRLLLMSDWTQLADAPLTEEQKQAWSVYRQELRDLPNNPGFPDGFDWPVQPGE